MVKIGNIHKEIVYWGTGNICEYCLEEYPDIIPSFFIASSPEKNIFKGKAVKGPDEVSDWRQYYIVIAIKSDKVKTEIQKYLEEKGLRKNEDFCTYIEAFSCANPEIKTSIDSIYTYMHKHPEVVNPIMLVVPVVGVRRNKDYIRFLSTYIKKRGSNRCIVFSNLQVITSEMASDKLGCPVFYVPDTNNIMRGDDIDLNIARQIKVKIPAEEINWLEKMEDRKLSPDKEKSFCESIETYYYYNSVIELVKPSKLIIWGNWTRDSYILGHLAGNYEIPHGYMEHGWLPGTYQVDPRGIGGQSEYAVNPQIFDKLEVKELYDIEQIKQYIIDLKLDTRTFINTEEDNASLLRIKENRKTVFLVGMDDFGMQMNPKNDYWKKHISNVVESTEQALFLLSQICKKNKWNLIFKPHPTNPVKNWSQKLEDVILVRDMEIGRLIELADIVVSIASAVDYKVLIYGKALVQLGITGLLGKGCTYIVNEGQLLEEQLILALSKGMSQKQKDRFNHMLQILLQKYLWDDMSERSQRYGLTVEQDFLE